MIIVNFVLMIGDFVATMYCYTSEDSSDVMNFAMNDAFWHLVPIVVVVAVVGGGVFDIDDVFVVLFVILMVNFDAIHGSTLVHLPMDDDDANRFVVMVEDLTYRHHNVHMDLPNPMNDERMNVMHSMMKGWTSSILPYPLIVLYPIILDSSNIPPTMQIRRW